MGGTGWLATLAKANAPGIPRRNTRLLLRNKGRSIRGGLFALHPVFIPSQAAC
ncbi:hypothetical protein Z945_3864 [Sulfitobacter noctilucae]|nr:hypothetical protein Z945_3864 [Sulfitobacter noctilucae]